MSREVRRACLEDGRAWELAKYKGNCDMSSNLVLVTRMSCTKYLMHNARLWAMHSDGIDVARLSPLKFVSHFMFEPHASHCSVGVLCVRVIGEIIPIDHKAAQ